MSDLLLPTLAIVALLATVTLMALATDPKRTPWWTVGVMGALLATIFLCAAVWS